MTYNQKQQNIRFVRFVALDEDNNLTLLRTDEDGKLIVDMTTKTIGEYTAYDLLEQMLTTLKKIEYHLSMASDTHLEDQDV